MVIFCVETPFLLLPMQESESKFRLLGEAFVEDCMKAEKTGGDNVKRICSSCVKFRSIFKFQGSISYAVAKMY
jgi:hypothetical protein